MKSRGAADVALPELERMLTTAAAGQVKESSVGAVRRIARRAPRVAAIGLTCTAIGGTAVAAGVWSPGVGTDADPGILGAVPTVATSPVPSAVTEVVGTLGREQTDADRDTEVEAALRNLSFGVDGVRLDSIRNIGEAVDGEATFLFSAEEVGEFSTNEEPVCVYRPIVAGEDAGAMCFGLSEILTGNGRVTYFHDPAGIRVAYGIVPDGVATLTAQFGSAPDRIVAVHDNYFELALSGPELSNANGESGVQRTVWHDADGNVIPQWEGDGYPGRWLNGYPDSVGWDH